MSCVEMKARDLHSLPFSLRASGPSPITHQLSLLLQVPTMVMVTIVYFPLQWKNSIKTIVEDAVEEFVPF
jgi:hypothetical protein